MVVFCGGWLGYVCELIFFSLRQTVKRSSFLLYMILRCIGAWVCWLFASAAVVVVGQCVLGGNLLELSVSVWAFFVVAVFIVVQLACLSCFDDLCRGQAFFLNPITPTKHKWGKI